MTIAGLIQDLKYLLPEMIVIVFGFVVLLFDGVSKSKQRDLGIVSLAAFASVTAALLYTTTIFGPKEIFFGMISIDLFSTLFRLLTFIAMFLTVLLSMGDRFKYEGDTPEYYALLLFMSAGISFLAMSKNLLMIYLSLELISLSSYMLVSLTKREFFSSEASLKYFLFGALSTSIMLFGISILYGLTGSFDLTVIYNKICAGDVQKGALYLAIVFLLAGFGFKIAMVPFHMWAPDIYQGAPTPITALISVGPKIAAFAVLLRVFYKGIGDFGLNWNDLVGILSILTMTVGNIIAISQNNIKRMLAYSSIAQAGYILIGFAVGTEFGKQSVVIYLLAYVFMNLGAFAVVIPFINAINSEEISDFKGLAQKSPAAAFALTIFLLSLAGIPPMAGFLGKFYIFGAAIEANKIYLAVAGVINSVIALFYYVRIIKFMYIDNAESEVTACFHPAVRSAILISVVATLAIGIYPAPFIYLISSAIKIF